MNYYSLTQRLYAALTTSRLIRIQSVSLRYRCTTQLNISCFTSHCSRRTMFVSSFHSGDDDDGDDDDDDPHHHHHHHHRRLSSSSSAKDGSIAEEIQTELERFQEVFEGNRRWVERTRTERPELFAAEGQHPRYLFIGCSDSRVPAQEITGLSTGELFVHRNISNLVVNTDINLLSVLGFAVEVLCVKHIIVCGHFGCGGVAAAMEHKDRGVLSHWLSNIRDVYRLHIEELNTLEGDKRYRRLVELNVQEQCINLFKTSTVQLSLRKSGFPRIHGLVYDIKNGYLKEIDLPLRAYHERYQSIYVVK